MWLHETFCFVVTKEYALETPIHALMMNPHLCEMFDSDRTDHIIRLWDRVRIGFNKCFLENSRALNWECEEVAIPFDALENALLFSRLSEGGLPNSCGFLFLAINEIISMYNVFTERIARFCTRANDIGTGHNAINPRFIIRGYGDTIKIGAVAPLTKECLNWVAECSWDSRTQTFNTEKLNSLLRDMIDLYDQPALISNPMDFLRQNFVFRDDALQTWNIVDAYTGVRVDHFGNFFANRQDAVLADDIYQLLVLLDLSSGEGAMRRTLMDHFHCLDYEQIRLMLEGSRNVLSVIHDSQSDVFFDTLDSLLDELVCTSDGRVDPFHEMGFPALDDNQMRLVRSLNSREFVELLLYLLYQMASEAYLFSSLPLYMKDPYTNEMKQELQSRLDELCGQMTARVVVDSLEVFTRDILAFYEIQLINAAAVTNQLLQPFLCSNNFCDDSDPVYAALPPKTALRNYVSLRQILHQMKLSFSSLSSDINPDVNADQKAKTSFNTTSQGRCWLWEGTNPMQENFAENDPSASASRRPCPDLWKLWFEKEIPCGEAVFTSYDTKDVNEVLVESTSTCKSNHDHSAAFSNAAKIVQTWWRRFTCSQRNEFTYEVCSDDDDDNVTEANLQSFAKTDLIVIKERKEVHELVNNKKKGHDSSKSFVNNRIETSERSNENADYGETVEKSSSFEEHFLSFNSPSYDVSVLDLSHGSQSDEMQKRVNV
jgi:hypothetical protein